MFDWDILSNNYGLFVASTEKLSSVKVKSLDEILAERHSSASIENLRQVNCTTNNDQLSITDTGIGDKTTTNKAVRNGEEA